MPLDTVTKLGTGTHQFKHQELKIKLGNIYKQNLL